MLRSTVAQVESRIRFRRNAMSRSNERAIIEFSKRSSGIANEETKQQTGSEQVHLRLCKTDADTLRRLARERDQTVSAFVRHMLRGFLEKDANRSQE